MSKPPKKPNRTTFKNTNTLNRTPERVPSAAAVRRKNSLTSVAKKDLDQSGGRDARTAKLKSKYSNNIRTAAHTQSAGKTNRLNEIERLVAQDEKKRTTTGVSLQVKVFVSLFVLSLLGTIACIWTMVNTMEAKTIANNLQLERVANSLENILSVLAYPALMFAIILMVYSIQQLYLLYRQANYLDGVPRRKGRKR